MTLDDDLRLSCLCGCTTIQIRGGYSTQTMKDVAELGLAATTLCRRKHYRRILWRWLLIACLAGVAVTAGVEARRRHRMEEAQNWCRIGETKLENGDDQGAIEEFTKSLSIHPLPLTYLIRGFAYYQLCDYDKAIADCDAALVIDPMNETAIKNRVMALERMSGAKDH